MKYTDFQRVDVLPAEVNQLDVISHLSRFVVFFFFGQYNTNGITPEGLQNTKESHVHLFATKIHLKKNLSLDTLT